MLNNEVIIFHGDYEIINELTTPTVENKKLLSVYAFKKSLNVSGFI